MADEEEESARTVLTFLGKQNGFVTAPQRGSPEVTLLRR